MIPATGPMRFCFDGCGVFVRGEHAAEFAQAVTLTLDPNASVAQREHAAVTVRRLLALLHRASSHGNDPETQRMAPFVTCCEAP